MQYLLGGLSGSLVGLTLGLFGGGGSILAVPLMMYLVGVPSAHVAIGTSAFAVAVNAGSNLIDHARRGNVRWRCAGLFTLAGVAGALLGSTVGKAIDGQKLLLLFSLLMLVIAAVMLRRRGAADAVFTDCTLKTAPRVLGAGAGAGACAGFFGIGGGFLIVPGLMACTGMPLLTAIGSSLVAVTAFGLTTTLSYALSGYVDWPLAATFVLGGLLGGAAGAAAACRLALMRGALNAAFAGVVCAVALYTAWRSIVS